MVAVATTHPADLILSPSGIEVRFDATGRAHEYWPELGPGLLGALLEGRRPPCRFRVEPERLGRISVRAAEHPLWIGVEVDTDAVRVSVRLADREGDPPAEVTALVDPLPSRREFLVFPHEVVCPHCGQASQRAKSLGGGIVVCGACGRSRMLEPALAAKAVAET